MAYKQIIDIDAQTDFEQNVLNSSYQEFLMQAQSYNRENKITTLQEMINDNPKANALHYKVGFSIGLFIKNLNGIIPGLTDSFNRININFITHEFQILNADITDKTAYKVTVNYFTDTYTLFKTFGEYLLLSNGDQSVNATHNYVPTFLLQLQPQLTIGSYKIN